MKLSTAEYVVREAFFSLKRNSLMSIASVGTVAVSLFIFGMFMLLVMNMNRMAMSLESQIEISVYVKDDAKFSDDDFENLQQKIENIDGVKEVHFINREQALERLKERLGEQKFLLEALDGENPLPNSYEVIVKEAEQIKSIAEKISQFDGVELAKYGQDVVEKLFAITRLIRVFGILLMILLAGATLFIISNTIRITVFARRKEVAIMKYVGATDWFIRKPFLLEGTCLGFFGAIVAIVMLCLVYELITTKIYESLAFLPMISIQDFLKMVGIVILLLGMAIGAIGSTISLKRFLDA